MEDRKPYENTSLLGEIEKVRDRQRRGEILVVESKSSYNSWPLPAMRDLPDLKRHASWSYTSRYGTFEAIHKPYGLYRFEPQDGEYPSEWSQYDLHAIIQPATALIDPVKRWARIVAEDGSQVATLIDVPVWERGWDLIDRFRTELAEERVPAVVWRVAWQCADGQEPLWNGRAPLVRNEHAAVNVAGYAYTHDGNLVYLSAVGHKTALEAIRASLLGRHRKDKLTLGSYGRGMSLSGLDDHYEQLWAPIEDFCAYHTVFVARQALEPEATDQVSYLLVFDGEDAEEQGKRLLIRRLNDGLPIPVLPEWANAFWQAAEQRGWLSGLEVGGDCRAGWQVSLVADWTEMVGELLSAGQIEVTI